MQPRKTITSTLKHRVINSTLPSLVCSISVLTAYKSRKSSHPWLLSCSIGRSEWRALTPAPRKVAPRAGFLTGVRFLNKGSKEANQKVSAIPVKEGPAFQSPFQPNHCITLPAALVQINQLGIAIMLTQSYTQNKLLQSLLYQYYLKPIFYIC